MHRKSVVILLLLCAIPALADQVVLKNGDRLTGSITKSDGKVARDQDRLRRRRNREI